MATVLLHTQADFIVGSAKRILHRILGFLNKLRKYIFQFFLRLLTITERL